MGPINMVVRSKADEQGRGARYHYETLMPHHCAAELLLLLLLLLARGY